MTGLIVILSFTVPIFIWAVWLSNREIKLRNACNAQQRVCGAFFDKAWKVIKQGADTSDEYRKIFEKVYPDLISGRYSGDSKKMLVKWVKEDNPELLTELYEKLMRVIENERGGFFREQEKLVELDLMHKNLRMTFPNNLILIYICGRKDIGINIIESDTTFNAFSDNKDNNVKLFT